MFSIPFELQVGTDGFRVEDPLTGPLIATPGTGALAAEGMIGKAVNAIVGPGDFEDLLSLVRRILVGGSVMVKAHRSNEELV